MSKIIAKNSKAVRMQMRANRMHAWDLVCKPAMGAASLNWHNRRIALAPETLPYWA